MKINDLLQIEPSNIFEKDLLSNLKKARSKIKKVCKERDAWREVAIEACSYYPDGDYNPGGYEEAREAFEEIIKGGE